MTIGAYITSLDGKLFSAGRFYTGVSVTLRDLRVLLVCPHERAAIDEPSIFKLFSKGQERVTRFASVDAHGHLPRGGFPAEVIDIPRSPHDPIIHLSLLVDPLESQATVFEWLSLFAIYPPRRPNHLNE